MAAPVSVEAPCGAVRGYREAEMVRFLGIPYAEPPLGRRRFAAPEPRRPFETLFDADTYGASAPQRRSMPGPLAKIAGAAADFSEDCLFLNVWTPDMSGSRPVLVFIHGGAFIIGSGTQYPGDDLAARGDAVVVTLNYRLGLVGFNAFAELFPEDDRFQPNAGLLDQRLALEWVRENIAAFGGDPGRVTLCGESAGAASVAFHLVSERSKPLFSQAILQSGAFNLFYPRDKAVTVNRAILNSLGISNDPDALFALKPRDLSRAMRSLSQEHPGILARPYFDGTEMPETSIGELLRRMKPVPTIIGTNRDEFTFFSDLPLIPAETGREEMVTWIANIAGEGAAERIARLYRDDRRGNIAFGTDLLFRMAAVHLAEAQAAREPRTFMYRLDWEAKGLLASLGATHSVDLPLLFEDFLKPFRSTYLGLFPDHRRQKLAERMRRHWMGFVRDGHPGPGWPAYNPVTRETKIFAERDRLISDPDAVYRTAWQGIDGYML
ncbi:carboxylesterase/lipase family protein [Aurantimonas sp. VKM B-3413]|uniref:carboxylesterase/lipase family protein n=1 Tax=Aurantimonas sp. VKM B-3413 TaxID=2779401 RepID=UPI001E459045|nr:carboxylesterase family protein [Aurantimonas sp. VKM B-3413]MCB8840542.1 carboxylesterase family protein [Aurantimonas sp. VKM B-3413]